MRVKGRCLIFRILTRTKNRPKKAIFKKIFSISLREIYLFYRLCQILTKIAPEVALFGSFPQDVKSFAQYFAQGGEFG